MVPISGLRICIICLPLLISSFPEVKGQNGLAPWFQQSSFNFTVQSCNQGVFVASIQAINPGGGSIAYSIDHRIGNPGFFAVNYQTGEINLAYAITGTKNFNFRATNTWGAAVIPIRVKCASSSSSTIGILCFNNICTNTTTNSSTTDTGYSFFLSNCNSGQNVGSLSYTNALSYFLVGSSSNFYINPTSGAITSTGTLSAGTYSFNVYAFTSPTAATTLNVVVGVTCSGSSSNLYGSGYVCFGGYCYGAINRNTSNSNTFSTTACSSGTSVGTVVISNANAYQITSGGTGFTISSSGALTLSTAISTGTYYIGVTGYNNGNTQSTTTATVSVSCTYGSVVSIGNYFSNVYCLFANCDYNYTAPVFVQTYYTFSSSCSSGTTVGTVTATGAMRYTIETGPLSNYFSIGATTGVITGTSDAISGQQIVLTVTGTSNGEPKSVPVFITCAATTTSATTTTTRTTTVTTTGTTTLSTASPVFSQPLGYTFTPATCTTGTTVGTVSATNAVRFASSNNLFSVSSSGVITANSALTSGVTTTIFITASSSSGVSLSVPVAITPTCGTTVVTTTTTTPTGTVFTSTNCAANAVVGTVFVANTLVYNIANGNTRYTISPTGQITISPPGVTGSCLATCTDTFNVIALANDFVTQTTVPVTVRLTC